MTAGDPHEIDRRWPVQTASHPATAAKARPQTPAASAANRQFWITTAASPRFPVPLTRFDATSVSSLFICQTDYQQIKNGDYDACDHDRVKIAALLYGFDQGRRIVRLDHFTR